MRITVEQRGGFAGIAMRRSVDTSALPDEQASEVATLVAQADLFSLAEPPPRRGFDMQTYQVTVEDGERRRVLHLQDGSIPDSVKPLMQYMQRLRPA